MTTYDYTSMGFYTFDCLGWPFTEMPPGGGCYPIEELTLAVSGAAGTAAIPAAKMGLKTLAVGGVGDDLMGDWQVPELSSPLPSLSLCRREIGMSQGHVPKLRRSFLRDDETSRSTRP